MKFSIVTSISILFLCVSCGGGSGDDLDVDSGQAQIGDDSRTARGVCRAREIDESEAAGLGELISAFRNANSRYVSSQEIRSRNQDTVSTRAPQSVAVALYVHVITSGSKGALSDGAIQQQVGVLNSGLDVAPFYFVLEGIDRTENSAWYNMSPGSAAETQAKAALRIGDVKALNVYTCGPGDGILGWATFPWDLHIDPQNDGVVIHFGTLPGGEIQGFNQGDTLIHEAGHWLGLLHTFQNSCSRAGDLVGDTAAELSPSSGCPLSRDSCPGKPGSDPVTNFMDYTNDSCRNVFTPGQTLNMDLLSQAFRGL